MIISILEVTAGFVFSLDHGQLRVLPADFLVDVRGGAHAVEHQGPLHEHSLLGLVRVEDDEQLPRSSRVLGPDVGRHEGPFGETVGGVVVLWSFAQDH